MVLRLVAGHLRLDQDEQKMILIIGKIEEIENHT